MPEERNADNLRLSNEESNRITKESIQSALILLMQKKEFSNITVTEIVKKAGVSRTAYYRNYQSKEDVLNNLLSEVVFNIYKPIKNKLDIDDEYEDWHSMFRDIVPFANMAKLLFKAHFGEDIENGIYNMLIAEYTNPTASEKYIERFWSGAVCSIIKQWVMDDMAVSPEDMAAICCKVNE